MLLRGLAVMALGVSLAACGGGGGGDDGGGGAPTPPPITFSIGGNVAGLAGGASVVLANNGGNATTVSANGAFAFSTPVASAYAVTVQTQPANQTCTVTNGSGTATANVGQVTVACVTNAPPAFTIGGTVGGLAAGTSVQLRNNGGDDLAVAANGAFTFTIAIASGGSYAVTVLTQPAGQTCSVTNGSGSVGAANVTNVSVTCFGNTPPPAPTYSIGGTVAGLAGAGLVLHNNGGNGLPIAANGAFTFATAIATGAPYAVTVGTQPAGQTCAVANGAGTVAGAHVTNVAVTCVTDAVPPPPPPPTFTVGGTVSGLAGAGLVLRNNGGDDLPIASNGAFTFAAQLETGASYAVTVLAQPASPTQTCVVASGAGTIASANVASVVVTCTTSQHTVSGTVSGLAGSGLVLQNNGGNNLAVSASGAFAFTTPIASGSAYAVTVLAQPSSPTQTCVVANGAGTIATANVTNVAVTCTTAQFTVGGTVAGLDASGLNLRNNGGTPLAIASGATSFTFPDPVASGAAYAVTVSQQPPDLNCTVGRGTGTVSNANVTDVAVFCPSRYAFISNENQTPRVASYSVGANGGLTLASAISVGVPATGVAVTPSGEHVILAVDPSDADDGELRVYSVSSTGQLAFVSSVPMGPGTGGYSHTVGCGPRPGNTGGATSCGLGLNSAPETVLVHPNGRFVYVMDGVAGGACNPPGVAPCVPPAGVPAAGNRVIVRYTFDPATGALAYHEQRYVEGFVSFTMDPQGRFVWATSYLEHKIYEFRIDQTTGALTFGTGTFIGMSDGTMRMAVDPTGSYAYVSHAGDRTIDSYTIDAATGHLTNIGSIGGNCGAPGANCNKATNVSVQELAISANGRTLYGASTGVIAFALGADGSIGARLPGSPFFSTTPINGAVTGALVAVGSAGQFLYLQGYADGAARVFAIDPSNGALTETIESPATLLGGTRGTTALSLQ